MRPTKAVSVARATCHSTFKKLTRSMFRTFKKIMADSNGSIPVHSKVGYFRWFSIIRHTVSISIFQNASKCTISTFSPKLNNRKKLSPDAIFELKIHQNVFADPITPDPLVAHHHGRGLTAPSKKLHVPPECRHLASNKSCIPDVQCEMDIRNTEKCK